MYGEIILKVIIVLFVELNVYLCLGAIVEKALKVDYFNRAGIKLLLGFSTYHCVFWMLAFPMSLRKATLTQLTIVWIIVLGCFFLIGFKMRSYIVDTYRELIIYVARYNKYVFTCSAVIVFVIYYVTVNGQSDIDAMTYIGEVTTMVHTNKLVGVDIMTGKSIEYVITKYAFSKIGANSAVLCKIFAIHPLVFCRTIRAYINVILSSVVAYELFLYLFFKKENKITLAFVCTIIYESVQFALTDSIYTASRFGLYRTYEGKAYLGNLLIMMGILFAIIICRCKKVIYFGLMLMFSVSAISISASSVFLIPVVVGVIVLSYICIYKKWSYLIGVLVAFIPNMIYILLLVKGISIILIGR